MNIFVGENAGNRIFKVGTLCLIGIAHLAESQKDLVYSKRFECRPITSKDLEPYIMEAISDRPKELNKIIFNLFYAIKLVCSKVLFHMTISGNVTLCTNGLLEKQLTIPKNLISSLEDKDGDEEDDEVKDPRIELDLGIEPMEATKYGTAPQNTAKINEESFVFDGERMDSGV